MDSSRLACVVVCTVFLMGLLATTGHGAKLSIDLKEGQHCSEFAVITCEASDIDSSAKRVEIIQILKEQSNSKKMLAHINDRQNKIVYAKEKHGFTGSGEIDKSAQSSFLFLTLNDPKAEDEGEYSCEVYYTDAAGAQQHTVSTGTLRLTKKIKPEVSKTDFEDLQRQIKFLTDTVKSNDIDTKRKFQEQKKANDDLNDAQSKMTSLYNNQLDKVFRKGYVTKDIMDKALKNLMEKKIPVLVKPEETKKDLEDLQKQIQLLKSNDVDTKQKLQEQKKVNDDLNDAQSRMASQYNYKLDTVLRKGYVTKDTMDKTLKQLETSLGGSSDQEMAELNATLFKVKDDLQKKLEDLDVEQDDDLAKHVDKFEGIVKDLVEKATVSQIDDRVGGTETIVSKLAEKFNYLQDKVSVLEFLVQAPVVPEITPSPKEDPVAGIEVKLADLERQSQNQTQQISFLLDKAIESQGNITAFCASLLNSLTAVVGNKIVFDSVQLNKGQGYDPQTGIFTAPRSGIYAFQLVVMFRIDDEWTDIWIQKNGKLVTRLTSHDNTNENQASTSAVVSLVAGDEVENIITYTSRDQSKLAKLVNLRFSNFCGYFLQPL